jgi:hypothetical protein
LHYPHLEQRVQRVFPQVSWRRQARITAALTGALLAAGLSGIAVAAAQSREGHPLYEAHVAALQIGAVLPQTGPATPSATLEHRSKLLTNRVKGGPARLKSKSAVRHATASQKVAVFVLQPTPTPQRQATKPKPHRPVVRLPQRKH